MIDGIRDANLEALNNAYSESSTSLVNGTSSCDFSYPE